MEFHLEGATRVNKAIALSPVHELDFARCQPGRRRGLASNGSLSLARKEVLHGFRRENAVWAALAACALAMVAASLVG